RARFTEARSHRQALGDRDGEADNMRALAAVLRKEDNRAVARAGSEEALTIWRETNNRAGMAAAEESLDRLDRIEQMYELPAADLNFEGNISQLVKRVIRSLLSR